MILPFSILILATPISFNAVMISCRLALREKRKWMSLSIFTWDWKTTVLLYQAPMSLIASASVT